MPSSRMISGSGGYPCFLRGVGSRPRLAAFSKISFRRSLSTEAIKSANIAGNIAGLGIPVKKSQVILAYFDELPTGNLEFHQKGARLSQFPFRSIVNGQRKIHIGNHHGFAVRRPSHL